MIAKGWIWKPVVAGLSGTIVHFLFMYFKSRIGLLPSFQPYKSFQVALSHWVGTDVPAIVPWALSFLNGMTILGFLFGRINRLLPGRNGAIKGVTFGLIGWVLMGLIFLPMIGLGPFAIRVGMSRSCQLRTCHRIGSRQLCARYCCKSPKLPGDNFPALRRYDRRPSICVASITLPRLPVSLSLG